MDHGVQLAVADAVDLVQVVGVLHQHHLGLGAFQAVPGEALQQRVERGVVLEFLRLHQAARAVHEHRDGEGVDLDVGLAFAADQHGAGGVLDRFTQQAVGVHVLEAGQLDGAVQQLVLLLLHVFAHLARELGGFLAQLCAQLFAVFLFGQFQRGGAQRLGQEFFFFFGWGAVLAGSGALIFRHVVR
jgi:hypothetical protein